MKKKDRCDCKKSDSPGALFIPAGVLTGMGVGFLTGNVVSGLFLGLGVGFLLFAISELVLYLAKQ